MMRPDPRLATALAALATFALTSTALAQSPPASPPSEAPTPAGTQVRATFTGTSESAENHVHAVGAEGATQYGTIRLTGTADISGTPVEVEIVGTVFYRRGTGPFTGALTLRYPSGDELGLRYDAVVTAASDLTRIDGVLLVLDGSGSLEGVTGGGVIVASRTGPVGSPVEYSLSLDLVGYPE